MNISLDLTHSLRLMRKNLGFVCLCVLVIALGLGLSISMYSIISASVYRTLPYPDGERFVAIQKVDKAENQTLKNFFDGFEFQQLREASSSFKVLGVWRDALATLSDGETAEQFSGAEMSPELLQVTSVQALLGRSLSAGDAETGAAPVVLLSYAVWQNYYAGQSDIIGKTTRINGVSHTIVGVMPDDFRYPFGSELWLPLRVPINPQPKGSPTYRIMGVLEDGATLQSATIEVSAIAERLSAEWPEMYNRQSALAASFTRHIAPPMVLYHVLTVLTLSIVLLACLNVANLLVVRTNERLPELAIRKALGAGPRRLVQVVLADSLLICLIGSILGIALAYLGMATYQRVVEELWLGMTGTTLRYNYVWAPGTSMVALVTLAVIWLGSSSLTIRKVRRQDIVSQLASGTSGALSSSRSIGNSALVGFELIVSCFLLIVSGVLLGGALDMNRVDVGAAAENRLTGRINLPATTYSSTQEKENYRLNLAEALSAQPGVKQVTFTSALPSQPGASLRYGLEDRHIAENGRYPSLGVIRVADNYFTAMEVELREGRRFDSSDTANSHPVVIVDELFAQKMWPGESALGQRIQLNPESEQSEWLTVVGVTAHILQQMPHLATQSPSLYRPFSQSDSVPSSLLNSLAQSPGEQFSVVLTVTGSPEDYVQPLKKMAATVDRDVPVNFVSPLDHVLEISHAVGTFINLVSSPFALFTLILAITGIYALVSRSIIQRRQEIGVRRALGSNNAKVLRAFVGQSLKYLAAGLLIGGSLAVAASLAVSGFLTGIANWIPWVTLAVSLGLGLLVVVAAYKPASRLIQVEPGDALRYE